MKYVVVVVPATGQDRAAVFERGDGLVVVLADGAGGTGGGAQAATAIVDAVRDAARADWGEVLLALDGDPRRLALGQATAVVLSLDATGLLGASVGDSGAWLIRDGAITELTHAQSRKPLVGAGASPVAFRAGPLAGGTLLVASDGLLRYAPRASLVTVASDRDLDAAASQLVELVRLPSGELQDDVSIVLCRDV
jgi:serine/threonine protein phosphatase PrpC